MGDGSNTGGDRVARKKQRHTVKRISERLRCQATELDFKSCDREVQGFSPAQHTRESGT